MTKYYFGEFTAISNHTPPKRKTPPYDDCLFEARYLAQIQERADFEKGFIYDGTDGRYVPIASWRRLSVDGKSVFEITSSNGRTREIAVSDWLYYSREVLDYLPVSA